MIEKMYINKKGDWECPHCHSSALMYESVVHFTSCPAICSPIHYPVDLNKALCGSGWLAASRNEDDVTCPGCLRKLEESKKITDDCEPQYLCARCGHPESEHPVHGCIAFARE